MLKSPLLSVQTLDALSLNNPSKPVIRENWATWIIGAVYLDTA